MNTVQFERLSDEHNLQLRSKQDLVEILKVEFGLLCPAGAKKQDLIEAILDNRYGGQYASVKPRQTANA